LETGSIWMMLSGWMAGQKGVPILCRIFTPVVPTSGIEKGLKTVLVCQVYSVSFWSLPVHYFTRLGSDI